MKLSFPFLLKNMNFIKVSLIAKSVTKNANESPSHPSYEWSGETICLKMRLCCAKSYALGFLAYVVALIRLHFGQKSEDLGLPMQA